MPGVKTEGDTTVRVPAVAPDETRIKGGWKVVDDQGNVIPPEKYAKILSDFMKETGHGT